MGGDFHAYGASHVIVLVVFVAGLLPAVRLGRRARRRGTVRRTGRTAGLVLLALVIPLQVVDLTPGRFDLDTSLPIQLSDLAWMSAAVALLGQRQWAYALTYYWGLTLTLQAVLTPSLDRDVPDPRFLAFWITHVLVVWAAVYLTWGLGCRPSWRDYRLVVGVTAAWLAVVLAFNHLAGTNYGYVNRKPAAATALDHLGPWPAYVGVEVVILAAGWALMTWPWARSRRTTGGRASTRSG